MPKKLKSILCSLIKDNDEGYSVFDPARDFSTSPENEAAMLAQLNSAFLLMLAGNEAADHSEAVAFLEQVTESDSAHASLAKFYQNNASAVHDEIQSVIKKDNKFRSNIENLASWLRAEVNTAPQHEINEKIWSTFYPEALGVRENKDESSLRLQAKRKVTVTNKNPQPLKNPGGELLFTSNALLTIPNKSQDISQLPFNDDLKQKIKAASEGSQIFWFDHPVEIGVAIESNEIIYGLMGLNESVAFEKERGNMDKDSKATILLSVSVTHQELHTVAKDYIKEELQRCEKLTHLEVFVFTESDTQKVINDVLVPLAEKTGHGQGASELLQIFGVDGEYGRHYSFLKAIAAFWKIFINTEIKATFKIDLDQVFPQKELVEQTSASAFEHFCTPLWGAKGEDVHGDPVEFGMIAGALVNEQDIAKSVYYPDVIFSDADPVEDEVVFPSKMAMAVSTGAEMGTRYGKNGIDGEKTCIQRFHVTGGTNGILIDSLFKYRPFTPSFIGRAEDQAYLLSVLMQTGTQLAYLHRDGLIMRHDKEAFAQEAMKTAKLGNVIGDYIRTLYFSKYAEVITDDISLLKDKIDPFTGGFVTRIPLTVVMLRFCLRIQAIVKSDNDQALTDFAMKGFPRLQESIAFTCGNESEFERTFAKEQQGWELFYDLLQSAPAEISIVKSSAQKIAKTCSM